jgi:hypothetical protein
VDLRKLAPPAALSADWKAILADMQPLPKEIAIIGRYILDNDTESAERIKIKAVAHQQNRFAIARRDGFTNCAEA